ncbi:MAG: MAE_28990/MAE_18760 family HEPN-like nuclease [Sulfurovum sp.]|nr:MAE_28990/MAE_18760 family HEPN-like nuclease [Sulfurovum sp.]
MEVIILEFEGKTEEINEYFSFVRTTTHLRLNLGEDMIEVSETVHQVLKSNLFLLLYNVVESSFKNALEKICIEISNDELKYKDVISEIKKMWINKEYKNFNEKCDIPRDTSKSEFLMNKIDTITQDIVNIRFTNQLSGNVTPVIIKESINEYGLETHDIENPSSLFIIKNKRNNLAHGNEIFSECGREYTLLRLEEIKNESVDYMRFILEHIKDFIDEKKI